MIAKKKGERWFFGQDESCHWYLVPVAKRKEWEAWKKLPEDDERSWEHPDFAERLDGGPEAWTFEIPRATRGR